MLDLEKLKRQMTCDVEEINRTLKYGRRADVQIYCAAKLALGYPGVRKYNLIKQADLNTIEKEERSALNVEWHDLRTAITHFLATYEMTMPCKDKFGIRTLFISTQHISEADGSLLAAWDVSGIDMGEVIIKPTDSGCKIDLLLSTEQYNRRHHEIYEKHLTSLGFDSGLVDIIVFAALYGANRVEVSSDGNEFNQLLTCRWSRDDDK